MIYLVILLVILSLTLHFDAKGKVPPNNSYYWGIYVLLVLLMGLRYRIGGDTLAYMEYYKTVLSVEKLNEAYFAQAHKEFGYGVLWTVFCSVCKWFTNSFVLFQFVHAIIVNGVVFRFFLKHSKYVFANILFYYVFYFLTLNTEILRESLAICVFLLSIDAFFDKKWIKYYVYVFIAAQFHLSAYILLIVPFFSFIKHVKFIALPIVGVCLILLVPIIQDVLLKEVVPRLEEGHLKWKLILYMQHEINTNGVIFISLTKVAFPLILLGIDDKMRENYSKYRIFIIAFIIMSIGAIYIPPFERLSNYFLPFLYLWFVELVAYGYQKGIYAPVSKVVFSVLIVLLMLPRIYYYTKDTSERVAGTRFYVIWYPYYSVFNKQIVKERKQLMKTYVIINEYKERNSK